MIKWLLNAIFLALLACAINRANASPPQIDDQARTGAPQGSPSGGKSQVRKPLFFDLRSYIKAVTAKDAGLVSDRLAEISAEDTTRSTVASYLPQLTGNGRISYFSGTPLLLIPELQQKGSNRQAQVNTNSESTAFDTAGVTLQMPFFKDGSFLGMNTAPAVKAKRAAERIASMNTRLASQVVVFSATSVFLAALSTYDDAEIRHERLAVIEKQTALVKEQAAHGLASPADAKAAEIVLTTSRQEYEVSQKRAEYAFAHVAYLLGVDDARTIRIDMTPPRACPLPEFDGVVLRMNTGHPLIGQQQALVDQVKAERDFARIQLWPSAKIETDYLAGGDVGMGVKSYFESGLVVHVPIFDFGELHYAAKAADHKVQEETEKLAKVRADLKEGLFEGFTQVEQATQAASRAAAVLADAEKAFARAKELASFGQIPKYEFIASELAFLMAKENQQQASYAVLLAYASLEKASGGQWQWFQ